MNEFEKLEAELKELRPVEPSQDFTARLEKALGDAGNVAMCCLPDDQETTEDPNSAKGTTVAGNLISFPRLVGFAGLAGLGLAAVWVMVFYLSSYLAPDAPKIVDKDAPFSPKRKKMYCLLHTWRIQTARCTVYPLINWRMYRLCQ